MVETVQILSMGLVMGVTLLVIFTNVYHIIHKKT